MGGPVPENFTDDQIRAALAPHLKGDISFTPIKSGKFNTSYFVDAGAARHVLRIAPPADAGFIFYEAGMMAQEPELHRTIIEKTSVPAAAIIAYDTSHEAIDRDLILMERLPGSPQSEAVLSPARTARLLEQLGAALRQLHDLHDPGGLYGYLGEHNCMEPQSDWGSAFEIMWCKLIDDIEACDGYSPEEALAMRRLLESNRGHFDHGPSSSLLHMDVWAQNILTDGEGNLTGLVDFDRALWGDPEIEFAVLDYCGVSQPAFWEGYGRDRPDSPSAGVRHMLYYLYELQKYIVIERLRRKDMAAAESYRRAALQTAAGAT